VNGQGVPTYLWVFQEVGLKSIIVRMWAPMYWRPVFLWIYQEVGLVWLIQTWALVKMVD
jgi:hypothetical protein